MEILFFIILFTISLVLVTYLTNTYTKTREIGNTQIIISLCITAIALLLTNKIDYFEIGDVKIKSAFNQAQNKSIYADISLIPIDDLVINEKDNFYRLNEEIVEKKPDALSFYLNYKKYGVDEINKYLEILGKSNLKYIVFNELETQRFIGIVDFESLDKQLHNQYAYDEFIETKDFKDLIQNNNITELKTRLKGYISNTHEVKDNSKKIETLQIMEKIKVDYLPVVDSLGIFKGVVKRDRLASSLLIEVSNALRKE